MANCWLVKSEPEVYGIDKLKADKSTQWTGVRNYQARNFLMEMKVGDEVLFYHSNAKPTGIVGIARVATLAYPDPTQFDRKSDFFDAKSTKDKPRWFAPDLKFMSKFKQIISIEELRSIKGLSAMLLLQRGSRLSVTPVTAEQFGIILKLGTVD